MTEGEEDWTLERKRLEEEVDRLKDQVGQAKEMMKAKDKELGELKVVEARMTLRNGPK